MEDWTGEKPKFPFDELGQMSIKDRGSQASRRVGRADVVEPDGLRLVANVVKYADGDSATSSAPST